MAISQPQRSAQPLREPGDFRGTARMTDWKQGFDILRLQEFPFAVVSSPGFWDCQNIDTYSVEGTFRLCAKTTAIDAQGTDREFLYYEFANALYRVPTANFAAADLQKITSAVGVPAWVALTNVYPGA